VGVWATIGRPQNFGIYQIAYYIYLQTLTNLQTVKMRRGSE